ncbi:Hypothetical predicted protein [Octopus vulgaris]|uniref:Uncharacterized protein n=1 Tax=Octopus vulgaris TaxID=6645 RepID=A0AA36AU92_OCTVU|nr:Hypothetical predicted protein [Octopus vulgaris]
MEVEVAHDVYWEQGNKAGGVGGSNATPDDCDDEWARRRGLDFINKRQVKKCTVSLDITLSKSPFTSIHIHFTVPVNFDLFVRIQVKLQ